MSVRRLVALALVGAAVLFLVDEAVHFVHESQELVITQFGDPVGDGVANPGLAFSVPLVHTETYFDKRALGYEGQSTQVPTRDKRYVSVSAFAIWRIADALTFFRRVRDEAGAQARLDDILAGEIRSAVARYDLIELVRSTNRTPGEVAVQSEEESMILVRLEKGRTEVARDVLARATARAADLGIDVLDVRFKRISYVEDVQKAVFARMIAERQRIAQQYVSEGQGEAARIGGERDRDLAGIVSEAYRTAQQIRGRADADATRIYSGAHAKDPDFYAFTKSLETYEQTFDPNTVMVLDSENDFLKYLSRTR
jgi:membrane protease subunit HflC